MQSDLLIPTETDGLVIAINAGPLAPTGALGTLSSTDYIGGLAFPLSIGFVSKGTAPSFSITLQLLHGWSQGVPTIVVSRTIADIRFVDQRTMMLVVPMRRACACMGTSCQGAGDPSCENIQTPVLQPFNPALAPPSTMMGPNGEV